MIFSIVSPNKSELTAPSSMYSSDAQLNILGMPCGCDNNLFLSLHNEHCTKFRSDSLWLTVDQSGSLWFNLAHCASTAQK